MDLLRIGQKIEKGEEILIWERNLPVKVNTYLHLCISQFQLLTSLPPGDPWDLHILFAQPLGVLPTNLCLGGQGL